MALTATARGIRITKAATTRSSIPRPISSTTAAAETITLPGTTITTEATITAVGMITVAAPTVEVVAETAAAATVVAEEEIDFLAGFEHRMMDGYQSPDIIMRG